MRLLIENLVHVAALVTWIAFSIGIAGFFWCEVSRMLYERRRNSCMDRLRDSLHLMDRWCSHDFPVIEDVCERIKAEAEGLPVSHLSDFREMMRLKHLGHPIIANRTETH